MIPGRSEDAFNARIRAYLADAGKPDPHQYNAGVIGAGTWATYRVWAPLDAPPAMLRAILAGRL
jgi:hypothetical protein